jgi:hypothetical protein
MLFAQNNRAGATTIQLLTVCLLHEVTGKKMQSSLPLGVQLTSVPYLAPLTILGG